MFENSLDKLRKYVKLFYENLKIIFELQICITKA